MEYFGLPHSGGLIGARERRVKMSVDVYIRVIYICIYIYTYVDECQNDGLSESYLKQKDLY